MRTKSQIVENLWSQFLSALQEFPLIELDGEGLSFGPVFDLTENEENLQRPDKRSMKKHRELWLPKFQNSEQEHAMDAELKELFLWQL